MSIILCLYSRIGLVNRVLIRSRSIMNESIYTFGIKDGSSMNELLPVVFHQYTVQHSNNILFLEKTWYSKASSIMW